MLLVSSSDEDLSFLNTVYRRLERRLGANLSWHKLFDQQSHINAKTALERRCSELVLICAHGGNGYIRNADHINESNRALDSTDKFFTRDDVSLFTGKVIICLSCYSNSLAAKSISDGALAFVGFEDVPLNRFDTSGNPIGSQALVKHTQGLVAGALDIMLASFLGGESTLDQSVDYFRIWLWRQSIDFVRNTPNEASRREIAALSLRFEAGIRYHGVSGIRFKAITNPR